MITLHHVRDARRIIAPAVHVTPLLASRQFDELTEARVHFKAENLQRIGAFKIRGAYNKIASLSADEKKRGVVAHSSGNHAQGVALASKMLGVKATIVMPHNSLQNKVQATREYGAEVIFCDDSLDARIALFNEQISEHGYAPVPPYDDDHIIAGQGTAGLEIAEALPDLDYFFCPIGGGGLISGCAVALKSLIPGLKIIGVETEPANDCQQSFRAKQIVKIKPPKTIADGMRNQNVGNRNFEIILKYVDDVVTVTDDEVIAMVKFFMERMKTVVEPTGAVSAAAVMFGKVPVKGRKVCCLVSGGNIALTLLKQWL